MDVRFGRTGATDGDVDAPVVHAKIDAGDRTDSVYHQQRRMAGIVHRLADGGDVAGDAGGGFVLAHQDGLDLVVFVGGEPFGVFFDRDAFAPIDLDGVDVHAVTLAEINPEV